MRAVVGPVDGPPEDRPLCDGCSVRPASVVITTASGAMQLFACAECCGTPGAIPELTSVTFR